ncbi:MAG: leucine-rich repeat domain-containing protein, partial [Solobacterium sp.]|nr:leucine-rich repeat domain-containing protein [Solobacterium sp.]
MEEITNDKVLELLEKDELTRLEIRQLEQVKEVSFPYGSFSDFPANARYLKNVETIQMKGIMLFTPELVQAFSNLRKLSVASTFRAMLAARLIHFKASKRNKELFLQMMEEWTGSLSKFTQLQTLNLIGLTIRSIPDSISALKKLEVLCLTNNMIEEIPEWLGEIPQLKELNLRGNRIT